MVVSMDRAQKTQHPVKKQKLHADQREQTVEAIKTALEEKGIDYRHAFAVLALDERGNIRFPNASIQGSLHDRRPTENPIAESSHFDTQVSEADGIERDGDVTADSGQICDSQPSAVTKNRRIVRQTRQRGGRMLARDASRFSCAPYPSPNQTMREPATIDAVDEEPVLRPKKQMKSFRIDDPEKVVGFLSNRLKRMQQLADKKIAKAWIKGICPKKQAKYPYSNNKREQEEGKKPVVPDWWPDVDTVCRFIEPDHIRREERMRLCVHLLRLRPSPEDFKKWNNNDTEPSKTHIERGWTAFLMDLAGPEIFDDLPKETPEKLKLRQDLMAQMYNLAAMEEEYLKDERDGSELFMYEEDEDDRKPVTNSKRPHRLSIASTIESEDERQLASASRTQAKRVRQNSVSNNPIDVDLQHSIHQDANMESLPIQTGPRHSTSRNGPYDDGDAPSAAGSFYQVNAEVLHAARNPVQTSRCCPTDSARPIRGFQEPPTDTKVPMWRGYDPGPGQWVDSSASSCCGQQFSDVNPHYMRTAHHTFPGRQDFEFPQYPQHGQDQVQVHHVGHVPQPEFHGLPNTHTFSPTSLVPMPMSSLTTDPDHHLLQDQSYSTSMPSGQYFMPAYADPSVADFHPPSNLQPGQYQHEPGGLAQRHMAPMQHGLPFTYPGGWQPHEHR